VATQLGARSALHSHRRRLSHALSIGLWGCLAFRPLIRSTSPAPDGGSEANGIGAARYLLSAELSAGAVEQII